VPNRATLIVSLTLASTLITACDDDDFTECEEPTEVALSALPDALFDAGLFTDMATEALVEGVWAYEPRFKLWTDGATKRRWFSIPEGAVIDTTDMDQWRFPEGTVLFKEFTRDGVRVETRILKKTGVEDDAWSASAYLWAEDQSDAFLMPEGGDNQGGTAHDVPAAADCAGCHGGRASRVLGFSAVQLAWGSPEGHANVSDLKAAGVLTDSVPDEIVLPASEQDADALGYLHANCSHCHNTTRPVTDGPRCYDPQEDFNFSIPAAGIATVEEAPAYMTGVAENVLTPGDAGQSDLVQRLSGGPGPQMPALGTEIVDPDGEALLTSWVDAL
jgi:hypothetical protein